MKYAPEAQQKTITHLVVCKLHARQEHDSSQMINMLMGKEWARSHVSTIVDIRLYISSNSAEALVGSNGVSPPLIC